jgi:hypothetical protein
MPPEQMSGAPWADFVRSKQYRGITQVGGMTVQCHEGRILNTLGQDTKYDNHGYTPLPGGENPVRFEPGVGQVYHLFPEGRGPGRECLFVDHRHVFIISGPGGVIADLLSNPFDIPLAFHRVQYRVCCPGAGEATGRFTVNLESSNFPSAKTYIDGEQAGARFQQGLGEFMFSNPDDRSRFPPSAVLTEHGQDLDCDP